MNKENINKIMEFLKMEDTLDFKVIDLEDDNNQYKIFLIKFKIICEVNDWNDIENGNDSYEVEIELKHEFLYEKINEILKEEQIIVYDINDKNMELTEVFYIDDLDQCEVKPYLIECKYKNWECDIPSWEYKKPPTTVLNNKQFKFFINKAIKEILIREKIKEKI